MSSLTAKYFFATQRGDVNLIWQLGRVWTLLGLLDHDDQNDHSPSLGSHQCAAPACRYLKHGAEVDALGGNLSRFSHAMGGS